MDPRLIRVLYHRGLDTWPTRRLVGALARRAAPPQILVAEHDIPVRGLPLVADGLRILHVSDLHLRRGSRVATGLPDAVADHRHDLIVYTGDLIDSDEAIDPVVSLLARMPGGAPAYAVFGDHDHWAPKRNGARNDTGRLRDALRRVGISVLCNESAAILGGAVRLVGVDDPVTGSDDLARANADVPLGACTVLLAHTPDILTRDRGREFALVLCGHTHGGQIRAPIIGPIVKNWTLPRRLARGLQWHRGTPIFVNQGIGYSAVDIRIGCPPEVALLTLRRRT